MSEIDLDRDFIELQAGYLRKQLKKLSLDGVTVNPDPVIRDATDFDTQKTLAYSYLNELSIAIIASIGAKRASAPSYPVTGLLIPPFKESAGLLVDNATNLLYTNNFWVCEGGEFKYIKTTNPIPIDGWDVAFDPRREDPALNLYHTAYKDLYRITDDKYLTRQVLEKAGVEIPKGTLLNPLSDINSDIDKFVAETVGIQGLVVKGLHGSQGKNVWLFSLDEIEEMKKSLAEGQWSDLILEERIMPVSASEGLLSVTRFNGVKNPDYNFRVVTTLDRDDPVVVVSEIRYQEMGNKPVNISLDAKATRLNTLGNHELTRKIHETALAAIRAVCRESLSTDEYVLGIGGVDLMCSEDGRIPVLEVNTGFVGGFGTLCRVDGQPLGKIRDALLPGYRPYIEDRFARRIITPKYLRRLPLSQEDRSSLFNFYMANGKYQEAQNYLLEEGDQFDDARLVAGGLIVAGRKLAVQVALGFMERAIEREPENFALRMQRGELLKQLD